MPEVKCTKCGSTKLEVISYEEVEQTYTYYAADDE